jgi:hypothetical protein
MAEELELPTSQADLDESMIQGLASAVRKGFDTIAKLEYANAHKEVLGRVKLHKLYNENLSNQDLDLGD